MVNITSSPTIVRPKQVWIPCRDQPTNANVEIDGRDCIVRIWTEPQNPADCIGYASWRFRKLERNVNIDIDEEEMEDDYDEIKWLINPYNCPIECNQRVCRHTSLNYTLLNPIVHPLYNNFTI